MPKDSSESEEKLVGHTTEIVSAYVSHNPIPWSEVPTFINNVYHALSSVKERGGQPAAPPLPTEAPRPVVPWKKSVFPDYLVCLEDGKKLKSLKRHIMAKYNLTPQAYRDKFGLPNDYPMVAPNYSRRRSELAIAMGLGEKRRKYPKSNRTGKQGG